MKTKNVEIHLPFGFVRVGREYNSINPQNYISKTYGYKKGWRWGYKPFVTT